MDFAQVAKQLNAKELEELMMQAYGTVDSGPFVVENIRVIGGQKEVGIRYSGSTKRVVVVLGNGHDNKEGTGANS